MVLGGELRDQVVEGAVGLAVEESEAAGEAVSHAVAGDGCSACDATRSR